MNNLLSVIVPIYNVEKYLNKCVDSIINQTYKNLEIILVDDGSTDASGKIADSYLKIDKRIRVYHKKNGGLADARNYGLKNATGMYVAFIDSDDWIDHNAYKDSIEIMNKTGADMFVFQAISVYNDTKTNIINSNEYRVIENSEIFNSWGIIGRGVCDKIFIRNYWNDIEFPYGKTSEDIYVIYKLMAKAKKTILSSNVYYYYRQRLNSISKSKKIRIDSYEAYLNVKKFVYLHYQSSYNTIMKHFVTNCMGLYNNMIIYDKKNENKNLMLSEIKKNKKYIFNNKNVSKMKKIQLFALLYLKNIYYIIMKNKTNKTEKKLFNNN